MKRCATRHSTIMRVSNPAPRVSASWRSVTRAALPKASIIHAAMLWIEMYAAVEGQAAASSSNTSAASSRASPAPPCSAPQYMAANPSPAARRSVSTGNTQFSSHSAARGAISAAANRRAASRIASCSSLNPNAMRRPSRSTPAADFPPHPPARQRAGRQQFSPKGVLTDPLGMPQRTRND